MLAAREYRIVGSVQGVGFRWTAKRIADSVGVSGWVRNNADGSVSLALEGDEALLEEFMSRFGEAFGSGVAGAAFREVPPGSHGDGFDIVR